MAALRYDHVDAKLKAELALKTRDYKKEVDREKIESKWQEVAAEHEAKHVEEKVPANSNIENRQPGLINYLESKWMAFCEKYDFFSRPKHIYDDHETRNKGSIEERAVNYAINHLSERETVWEEKNIYKTAMGYAAGETNLTQLISTVNKFKKEGILLIAQTHLKQFETPLTTKVALVKELETIDLMKSGKDTMKPLYQEQEVAEHIKGLDLNSGQKETFNRYLQPRTG